MFNSNKNAVNFYGLTERNNMYFIGNTLFSGIAMRKYKNGKIKAFLNFQEGVLNGKMKSFYPNGKTKAEGNFLNGELDGKFTFYYEDGSIKEKAIYKNGKKDGEELLIIRKNYQNGKMKAVHCLKNFMNQKKIIKIGSKFQ